MHLIRNITILVVCISSYANAQSDFPKKESNFKAFSTDKSTKNYNVVCGDILNASPRYNISSVSGTARIAGYFLDRIRFKISKFGYNGGKLEESEYVNSE